MTQSVHDFVTVFPRWRCSQECLSSSRTETWCSTRRNSNSGSVSDKWVLHTCTTSYQTSGWLLLCALKKKKVRHLLLLAFFQLCKMDDLQVLDIFAVVYTAVPAHIGMTRRHCMCLCVYSVTVSQRKIASRGLMHKHTRSTTKMKSRKHLPKRHLHFECRASMASM